MDKGENRITGFWELEVYQNTYEAMLQVMENVVLNLPKSEKHDLVNELSKVAKSIPRLIAEGYAKRNQSGAFQKYIEDSRVECNEMVVNLSQCRDLYPRKMDPELCNNLIDTYDESQRQLQRLSEAWENFNSKVLNGKTSAGRQKSKTKANKDKEQ